MEYEDVLKLCCRSYLKEVGSDFINLGSDKQILTRIKKTDFSPSDISLENPKQQIQTAFIELYHCYLATNFTHCTDTVVGVGGRES